MTSHTTFRWRWLSSIAILVVVAAGCSNDDNTSAKPDRIIATFEAANGEQFKVELATPELIDHAKRLLSGENISAIPNGFVVRDEVDVNAPWSWHIDPNQFEFAFVTTEVCDGIPSDVENRTITSDHYCPWSAKIISVESAT